MFKKFLALSLLLGLQLNFAYSSYFPCFRDGTCSAGYLTPSVHSSNELFYWFFNSQDGNKQAPLIVWLQGGPGCSSMLGLFMENGPMALSQNKNGTFAVNKREITWTQNAHVLFIDQPVGTGYAVNNDGSYVTSDKEGAQQALFALLGFFTKHPELQSNPLFISGESYGGHWVPSVAMAILDHNKKASKPLLLQGISVGDPLIDAYIQVQGYPEYAKQTGLISNNEYPKIKKMADTCANLIQSGNFSDATQIWNDLQFEIVSETQRMPYDIRLSGIDDADMDLLQAFLNRTDVKSEIGLPTTAQYNMCNMNAYAAMADAFTRSVAPVYAVLAMAGVKTLVYCGNMDPAVPCPALEDVLSYIYGAYEFANATNVKLGNDVVAWSQKTPQMWYYNFFNAGHMVPEDQAQAAFNMMFEFINWTALSRTGTVPAGRCRGRCQ